jgi:hypothetical protein
MKLATSLTEKYDESFGERNHLQLVSIQLHTSLSLNNLPGIPRKNSRSNVQALFNLVCFSSLLLSVPVPVVRVICFSFLFAFFAFAFVSVRFVDFSSFSFCFSLSFGHHQSNSTIRSDDIFLSSLYMG